MVRPNGQAPRSIEELCQPSINGWGGPIASIPIQATDFGLCHHMIQQVQNTCQFHGLPGDDAYRHIDKFLEITQNMKQNGVSDDALRLSLFPYSLTHAEVDAVGSRLMLSGKIDTAAEEAIKSRFSGNDESKKMQKYLLKQQFEGFSVSSSEGLHKRNDRFQTLLSQLEIHGAGVSHKDANQKVLRSLPSSWSQVALIMRTKPGLDTLSFNDLYNNLRVFEHDVKGTTASSSNTQNVAFLSTNNTSTTNDINNDDMEEMNLKWQVAMISMRIKKFYKRTRKKLQFDTKDPVGFDKTKVKCFNCHKMGHFARDCKAKGNQDSRRRDAWYNRNKARDNGIRPVYQDDSNALVTIDGEDID
nr:ribonuclease H-like domain-containing protein [Tanacetum cinerariifolium]